MAMEVEEYPRHDDKTELAAWHTDTWLTLSTIRNEHWPLFWLYFIKLVI